MNENNGVQYHLEPERLWTRLVKMEVENNLKKTMKLDCMQISLTSFYMQSKEIKKIGKEIKVFSANMVDDDKILNIKPKKKKLNQ